MKLKTLLLGGILALFSVSSFSSAVSFNGACNSEDPSYMEDYGTICGPSAPSAVGETCEVSVSGLGTYEYESDPIEGTMAEGNFCLSIYGSCVYNGTTIIDGGSAGVIDIPNNNLADDMIDVSFSVSCSSSSSGGGNGGTDNGGDMDLIDELSPVITGLNSTMSEFIPYVVYIGLGVLGVVIGFFAIKRLLRYVRRSALSPFKSRKRW